MVGSSRNRGKRPQIEDEGIEDLTLAVNREQDENDENYEDDDVPPPPPDNIPFLDPDNIWFRTSSSVVRNVSDTIKAMYKASAYPVLNWTEVDKDTRDAWFKHFRNTHYQWEPRHEDMVRHEFEETCKRRLRGLVYEQVNRPPKSEDARFIKPNQMKLLKEKMSTEDFKKKSATQKANKSKASEDGKLRPTYHGGSRSILESVKRLIKKDKETLPCPTDVFFDAHSQPDPTVPKGRKLSTKKANEVYENYRKARDGTEAGVPMDPVDAYKKASGGRKKGNTFGLGSAGDFWYKKGGKSGGSTAGSSTQGELYSQKMELQALVRAENENLERAEAYQKENEEYKIAEQKEKEAMKTRLLLLEQALMRGDNCSQMFTKTPRDPRDPSGGGGTGARDPLEAR